MHCFLMNLSVIACHPPMAQNNSIRVNSLGLHPFQTAEIRAIARFSTIEAVFEKLAHHGWPNKLGSETVNF